MAGNYSIREEIKVMNRNLLFCFVAIAALSLTAGCATKGYVNEQLEMISAKNEEKAQELDNEIKTVNEDVGKIRENISGQTDEIAMIKKDNIEKSKKIDNELASVREAVNRAEKASKLRKGKLLYQVTISDDSVSFAFNKAELSKEAEAALDTFAGVLVAENKEVYVEIQGHTDNRGTDAYNLELGFARAETVKRYLHVRHGIPLHRMSVISYGETKPVVENKTHRDRSKNRRVVLIVME